MIVSSLDVVSSSQRSFMPFPARRAPPPTVPAQPQPQAPAQAVAPPRPQAARSRRAPSHEPCRLSMACRAAGGRRGGRLSRGAWFSRTRMTHGLAYLRRCDMSKALRKD
eukprot:4299071-Prymnesium_polylepis.1